MYWLVKLIISDIINDVAMENKMRSLDKALEGLSLEVIAELEDVYEIWSWHPGMG